MYIYMYTHPPTHPPHPTPPHPIPSPHTHTCFFIPWNFKFKFTYKSNYMYHVFQKCNLISYKIKEFYTYYLICFNKTLVNVWKVKVTGRRRNILNNNTNEIKADRWKQTHREDEVTMEDWAECKQDLFPCQTLSQKQDEKYTKHLKVKFK